MQKQANEPTVSVVVAIYNVSDYLKKCVDSILDQTYDKLEIILVDDGSTDNSGEICDDYEKADNRVLALHKTNGGLSDARNAGIKKSTGEYITFIDGDDYIDRDYIETLIDSIRKYDSDISIVGHKIKYPKNIYEKRASKSEVFSPEDALREILYDREIDLSAWGKLYKTSLFNGVRYPKGRLFEDSATTYLLFDKAKKISVAPKSKYNYIIRSTSITNTGFNSKKYDLIASTQEMTDFIINKYPNLKSACERRMMWAHLSTLTQLAKSKNPSKNDINKLMSYIKKQRKAILEDKNISKRDRLSLYSTYFGFTGFKLSWKIYSKGRG